MLELGPTHWEVARRAMRFMLHGLQCTQNAKIESGCSVAGNMKRPPEVLPGDWGDVTLALTKRHGRTFAVLNMANAYSFGGGYAHGQVAQEENRFRRTDCADRRLFLLPWPKMDKAPNQGGRLRVRVPS